jgi:hypothetical protein
MKTMKIAVWINVLFYICQLCGAAWIVFNFLMAPSFPEIPFLGKFVFIAFVLVIHSVAAFCIIGLLRRGNWGRILTVFTNIFFSIGYLSGRIIGEMDGSNMIQVLTAQKVLLAFFVVISVIALTVILLTRKAKYYFKSA